jgi:hypothetical protein
MSLREHAIATQGSASERVRDESGKTTRRGLPPGITADNQKYKGGRFISREQTNNTTAVQYGNNSTPYTFTKRIGSTTYLVSVYSGKESRETTEDKIFRLIKREVSNIA